MTDATLPESTNSPAASLTSEPEKLLPEGIALEDVTPTIAAAFADNPCLIYSGEHRLYWRANAHGYTSEPTRAGRYTIGDAYERTRHCDPDKQIRFVRLSSLESGTDGPILPGVTLVKREADKECGCPEEEWETPWGYLFMHLNAGKPSDAALDNADAGEWETTITAPTINAARAAIFGWAATVASQQPVEGSAIGRALREVPDERFREIVDSLDVGRARSLICELMVDLRANLSASPTPPIPMIAEAGEREARLVNLRGHAHDVIEQHSRNAVAVKLARSVLAATDKGASK